MLGANRPTRDRRSTSRDPDLKTNAPPEASPKDRTKEEAAMSGWTEPALAEQPSYRDNSGVGYGVNEFMQPLGEVPNAKVKARVKADGGRKSLLGKNAAGLGASAQDTPEGTPAPATQGNSTPQPPIVIDDEDDGDWAPSNKPKLNRTSRQYRARVTPKDESTPAPKGAKLAKTKPPKSSKHTPIVNKNKQYDDIKLKQVVDAAKKRAHEVGKPDLAAAVNEIYVQSLTNFRLTELLECILTQTATKAQTSEFQGFVRAAKKKLRSEKELEAKEGAREVPGSANGSQSLPVRSPSKLTGEASEVSALPSTEPLDPRPSSKPTVKITSASKSPNRKRTSHGHKMADSPATKKRSGSVGSDSSLTDMTSNADDTDVDEVDGPAATTSKRVNGITGKDHAAERGSLAAPTRGVKRSSADAEIQQDNELQELAAKKQKLGEKVVRDDSFQESSMRATPTRQSTLRAQQVRNGNLPPALTLAPNVNTRGNRAVSADLDSPLSSAASSRRSTPQRLKPPKTFGKRAKTKQSPEKKHQHQAGNGGMPGTSGAGRESPIGDDDNEELSENNDFCSACGGSGFLLCCDGCDRSFHFSCLDPPLNEDASELNEPWYCFICVAKRPVTSDQSDKITRGLFAPLLSSLRKRNPSNFQLPQTIRDYFEGVASDKNGAFIESVNTRSRNRPGYDELPDFTKQKDGKGNTVLCYHCGKSSQGSRAIIQCDFCSENWHLDCLDPPLSNPPARGLDGKKIHDWMCPLHADHELRKMDTSLLAPQRTGRKVHIRRPRNAKVTETALQRGFRNNGVIDVLDDDSDSESEFFEEDDQNQSMVYKLPASGIKLDFIDKVKSTRVQAMRNDHAQRRARILSQAPRQLEQANFARRSFQEKQLALNLAQFANSNKDMGLGSDQVENLVGTLIAEAPSEVVEQMTANENAESARSASSAVPPSPPPSEQIEKPLSAEQRRELEMLQALIARRLGAEGKT